MAGASLTFAHLDPAARRVLERYTAELAAGLAGSPASSSGHPGRGRGGLAWPLAVMATTASATRLSLAGRAARRCVAARRLLA